MGLVPHQGDVVVIIGKPGALVTAVNLRSPSTARTCGWAVTSHTWLPSHIVMRLAAGPDLSSASGGGGSIGETRSIG